MLAEALAATYDVNLAVTARAADLLEQQAVRWVAEFVGYPCAEGAFTSGGMVSNLTGLLVARERALPGCAGRGRRRARRRRLLLGRGAPLGRPRRRDCGRVSVRDPRASSARRPAPDARRRRSRRRWTATAAAGVDPVAVVATGAPR